MVVIALEELLETAFILNTLRGIITALQADFFCSLLLTFNFRLDTFMRRQGIVTFLCGMLIFNLTSFIDDLTIIYAYVNINYYISQY